MAAKPAVDGLERELQGQVEVFWLEIQEPIVQSVAEQYKVEFVPSYVLLDRDRRPLASFGRHTPQSEEVLRLIGKS